MHKYRVNTDHHGLKSQFINRILKQIAITIETVNPIRRISSTYLFENPITRV